MVLCRCLNKAPLKYEALIKLGLNLGQIECSIKAEITFHLETGQLASMDKLLKKIVERNIAHSC